MNKAEGFYKLSKIFNRSFSFAISSILLLSLPSFANPEKLQSGPMVGYSEMKESLLWVQTKTKAKVKFIYWDKQNPTQKFQTDEEETKKEDAFTKKLILTSVLPGKRYIYDLYIDGQKVTRPYPTEFQTPQLWQHRTDPPEFSVAIGSCTYVNQPEFDRPGKPYGGGDEIFTTIYNKKPDIMLWLGDNIYLREPDWYSRTGILDRYTHTRALPEMQPLLASSLNYAIVDDHDAGPNDSDRSFRNKKDTLDGFKLFWGNPTFGLDEAKGAYTKFEWGDVEFFLLDNRTFRSPNNRKTGVRTMLGESQFEWLIDSLVTSKATFKIIAIGGQVLNPLVADYLEDYSAYPEEKEKLLSALKVENIKGVMFLSGDRHQTELTMLKRENTYPLYDFTISSLTSHTYDSSKENNYLRVPNSLKAEKNFALMKVSGKKKDRKLTFTIYNKDSKELLVKEIKESELK